MKKYLSAILAFVSLSVFGENAKMLRFDENTLTDFEFVPSSYRRDIKKEIYQPSADLLVWYKDRSRPILIKDFHLPYTDEKDLHDNPEDALEEAKDHVRKGRWQYSLDQVLGIQHGDIVILKEDKRYKKVIHVYLAPDNDKKGIPKVNWDIKQIEVKEP